ncbi:hypothetical protein ACVIGB_000728 [Bradyrhizobium sp. USDA 4341]
MKEKTSRSLVESLAWISENDHHSGHWSAGEKFFVLDGHSARLRIPAEVHVSGMMEADDRGTGRMYRVSAAGHAFLAAQAERPAELSREAKR